MLQILRHLSWPPTKSERRRGAVWAAVLVIGLSAIAFALLRWLPDRGHGWLLLLPLEILLYPGVFVGLIIWQLFSPEAGSEAALDWIVVGLSLAANWCYYFLVFSVLLHARNRVKQQRAADQGT
ncbi:MAG: hypothetical protein WAM91_13275 [Candidatus Acidiferrales bacterium]